MERMPNAFIQTEELQGLKTEGILATFQGPHKVVTAA